MTLCDSNVKQKENIVKVPILAAVACATLVASVAIAGPASAHDRSDHPRVTVGAPVTLTNHLFTPLSLEVDRYGVSYVTQNFSGVLTRVDSHGKQTTIATAPGQEIGAVSSWRDTVYYAQTAQDHSSSYLMKVRKGSKPSRVADIYRYEKRANPDRHNTYGFVDLPRSCRVQFDPSKPPNIPATYRGVVDTHPYASLALRDAVYVADAGGNDILRVGYNGRVSTVAVLPASKPVLVTAKIAASIGFPACSANHYYRTEPVPTDVELGPDGWLYVTSLPGGPEDASLGARGSVYKVNPHNGKVVLVTSGLVGATDLAVSKSGTIYVAELFGGRTGTGQVSVILPGAKKPTRLIALSSPAAIELHQGKLYVTTDAFVPDSSGNPQPIGKLTVVPLTRHGHIEDSVGYSR